MFFSVLKWFCERFKICLCFGKKIDKKMKRKYKMIGMVNGSILK